MKIYNEAIDTSEAVRVQYISWKDKIWNILSNDRFEENDFRIKVHCDLCGPDKYVSKVLDFNGTRICNNCLYEMHQMMQMATLEDCKKDRSDKAILQNKLERAENELQSRGKTL